MLHALDGLVSLEDPGRQSNFEITTEKLGAYKKLLPPPSIGAGADQFFENNYCAQIEIQ